MTADLGPRHVPSHPRVAVIIPCYEQAHFLPDTVASVCAQTYRDLEVIVVDDGSPDDTAAVAERLIAAHPGRRIRLLRQPNQGLAASRNNGIGATEAEFVLPLDADDLIGPEFVQDLVAALDARPDVSIAYGSLRYFGEVEEFHQPTAYDFPRLCQGNLFACTALFRRAAWTAVGGFDESFSSYEDWDFWLACGEHGHLGALVPRPVFFYRRRPGSMVVAARPRDQSLKAQLVLNHPRLYSAEQAAWARGVRDGDPAALAVDGPLGFVPELGCPPAAGTRSGGSLDGARGVAVLALAAEIADRPDLLRAFCTAFAAHDDATLVICGTEPELERLAALAAELGVDGPDAADLLGVVVSGDELGAVAARVDAMLTERPLRLPVGLPRFSAGGVPALRRLFGPRLNRRVPVAVS